MQAEYRTPFSSAAGEGGRRPDGVWAAAAIPGGLHNLRIQLRESALWFSTPHPALRATFPAHARPLRNSTPLAERVESGGLGAWRGVAAGVGGAWGASCAAWASGARPAPAAGAALIAPWRRRFSC